MTEIGELVKNPSMRTSHYSIGEPIGSEKNDTEFKQVVIPIHFWNHFDEECADTFILTEKFDRAIRKHWNIISQSMFQNMLHQ